MKKLSKIHIPTFTINYIPDEVFTRMKDKSYPENATILLDDLRYLQVSYYNFNNESVLGEIVCNKSIAEDLIDIFKKLYGVKYQICSIRLVDDFDADDDKSMTADNTSCFNFRYIRNTNRLSPHAYGVGIDINPVENPCIRDGVVHPEIGSEYVNRSLDFKHKIDEDDLCYKLFTEHGFTWGGSWDNPKDYHHFEKRSSNKMNESMWSDIHKRSNGEQIRKEDEIGNIKSLKPIDMGLSVIWADRDLVIDGNDYFEFNEIKVLTFPNGWRLPTLEEVAELDTIKNLYASNDNEFYFDVAGQHLGFPKVGFIRQIYSSMGCRSFPVDENRFYYGWTSTPYDNGSTHILTFDEERIWHSPVNNKRTTDQVIQPNQDKLCVRLVKDK